MRSRSPPGPASSSSRRRRTRRSSTLDPDGSAERRTRSVGRGTLSLGENEVETILGPLSWDETGAPTGEFLIGQWQNGKAEIVLPEEAATSDTIIEGYKPGGGN